MRSIIPLLQDWLLSQQTINIGGWSDQTTVPPTLVSLLATAKKATWTLTTDLTNISQFDLIWIDGHYFSGLTEAYAESTLDRLIAARMPLLATDMPYGIQLPDDQWNTPDIAIKLTDKPAPVIALTQPLGTRSARLFSKQLQLAQVTYLRSAKTITFLADTHKKSLLKRQPEPAKGYWTALQQADGFHVLGCNFWVGD